MIAHPELWGLDAALRRAMEPLWNTLLLSNTVFVDYSDVTKCVQVYPAAMAFGILARVYIPMPYLTFTMFRLSHARWHGKNKVNLPEGLWFSTFSAFFLLICLFLLPFWIKEREKTTCYRSLIARLHLIYRIL